jgi:hypothetical protein
MAEGDALSAVRRHGGIRVEENVVVACRRCGETKPRTEFSSLPSGKPKVKCKACVRAYGAEWRKSPDARLKQTIHRRNFNLAQFGLRVGDYDLMLAAQGGACAICRAGCPTGRRLAVDHDHASGRVRALLCFPCNARVGLVENRCKNWQDYEAAVFAYLAEYGDGNPVLAEGLGVGPLPRPEREEPARHPNGPGNYNLLPGQVEDIRRRFGEGAATRRELAREYGVAHSTVGRIVNGSAWRKFAA